MDTHGDTTRVDLLTHESGLLETAQLWRVMRHRYTFWFFGIVGFPPVAINLAARNLSEFWRVGGYVGIQMLFLLTVAVFVWLQARVFRSGAARYTNISLANLIASLLFVAPAFVVALEEGGENAFATVLPALVTFLIMAEAVTLFFIVVVVPIILGDIEAKRPVRHAVEVLSHVDGADKLRQVKTAPGFSPPKTIEETGRTHEVLADCDLAGARPPEPEAGGPEGQDADSVEKTTVQWGGEILPVEAIRVIRAEGNYISVELDEGMRFLPGPMRGLVEKLPDGGGMTVNRSTWVAYSQIRGYVNVRGEIELELTNAGSVRVGRTWQANVRRYLAEVGLA